jgi:hypothetical protein
VGGDLSVPEFDPCVLIGVLPAYYPPPQRPGACGVFHVIPPAPGDQEGLGEFQESGDDLGVCVVGQREMCQRIAPQGVHPEFQDENVRSVRLDEREGDLTEGIQEGTVVCSDG